MYSRRRYVGGMKTSSRGSRATGQLAVYRNAFSTATTNPKIPDGKAYHSAGIRLQAVKEFVNDSAETMDFLLFPGLNNGVVSTSTTNDNGLMPYPNHAGFALVGGEYEQADGYVNMWRVVSQAIKFTLINNSDENDGWWEACRVQLGPGAAFDWQAFGGTTESPLGVIGNGATAGNLPGVDVTRQLVENPTYVTGKLRDIHRHVFQLHPQGSDHDFIKLRRRLPTTPGEELNEKLLDDNFDGIYIRIHGRTGVESPTRVMAHVVSNQEIVYDEDSSLSRYHSECTHSPSYDSAKRAIITQSPSASKRQKYSTS